MNREGPLEDDSATCACFGHMTLRIWGSEGQHECCGSLGGVWIVPWCYGCKLSRRERINFSATGEGRPMESPLRCPSSAFGLSNISWPTGHNNFRFPSMQTKRASVVPPAASGTLRTGNEISLAHPHPQLEPRKQ